MNANKLYNIIVVVNKCKVPTEQIRVVLVSIFIDFLCIFFEWWVLEGEEVSGRDGRTLSVCVVCLFVKTHNKQKEKSVNRIM